MTTYMIHRPPRGWIIKNTCSSRTIWSVQFCPSRVTCVPEKERYQPPPPSTPHKVSQYYPALVSACYKATRCGTPEEVRKMSTSRWQLTRAIRRDWPRSVSKWQYRLPGPGHVTLTTAPFSHATPPTANPGTISVLSTWQDTVQCHQDTTWRHQDTTWRHQNHALRRLIRARGAALRRKRPTCSEEEANQGSRYQMVQRGNVSVQKTMSN